MAAFLLAAASDETNGRVYNLGGERDLSLLELAELVVSSAGSGVVKVVPFPEDRKSIDIGDFYADWAAIERDLAWRPTVPVETGLRRTLDFYREHGEHYWDAE